MVQSKWVGRVSPDGDGYAMSWREGLVMEMFGFGLESAFFSSNSFVLRLMCSFGGCLDHGDLGYYHVISLSLMLLYVHLASYRR